MSYVTTMQAEKLLKSRKKEKKVGTSRFMGPCTNLVPYYNIEKMISLLNRPLG